MVKLYTHPFSTYARRVDLALHEKSVQWERVTVDMAKGAHRQPDYLELNPYGRVPSIDDDGCVLYESTAILGYIESKHPTPALAPTGLEEKATMWMHVKLCDLQFSRPTGTIIFPKRFIPEAKWRKEDMAKASATIQEHLNILEPRMEGKRFIVGDELSLADLCYLPFLQFLPILDVEIPPNIDRWSQALFDRPSAQATVPPDAPKWH